MGAPKAKPVKASAARAIRGMTANPIVVLNASIPGYPTETVSLQ